MLAFRDVEAPSPTNLSMHCEKVNVIKYKYLAQSSLITKKTKCFPLGTSRRRPLQIRACIAKKQTLSNTNIYCNLNGVRRGRRLDVPFKNNTIIAQNKKRRIFHLRSLIFISNFEFRIQNLTCFEFRIPNSEFIWFRI